MDIVIGTNGVFVTEIKLQGQMVCEEGLIGKSFKIAGRNADAVLVRSLGENTACHYHNKKEKDYMILEIFHNMYILVILLSMQNYFFWQLRDGCLNNS